MCSWFCNVRLRNQSFTLYFSHHAFFWRGNFDFDLPFFLIWWPLSECAWPWLDIESDYGVVWCFARARCAPIFSWKETIQSSIKSFCGITFPFVSFHGHGRKMKMASKGSFFPLILIVETHPVWTAEIATKEMPIYLLLTTWHRRIKMSGNANHLTTAPWHDKCMNNNAKPKLDWSFVDIHSDHLQYYYIGGGRQLTKRTLSNHGLPIIVLGLWPEQGNVCHKQVPQFCPDPKLMHHYTVLGCFQSACLPKLAKLENMFCFVAESSPASVCDHNRNSTAARQAHH